MTSAHDHDIFISYAHVSDLKVVYGEGEAIQWVTKFREALQNRLDQELGKSGGTKIWMDSENLRGNDPVNENLKNAVRKTAILIAVLSNGYKMSEWCNRELKEFATFAMSKGKLFVVHFQDVPREERPEEMQDLNGYIFFDEQKSTLGPLSKPYNDMLQKLAREISSKLKEIKSQERQEQDPEGYPPNRTKRPTAILLAAVPPHLKQKRDSIKTYLQKEGYTVIPDNTYPSGLEAFKRMLDQDLREAKLFVQWLDQVETEPTVDFPISPERLQLERAREAGRESLRAYQKDTVEMADVKGNSLLKEDNVMALDLEDFKPMINDKLKELEAKTHRSVAEETPIVIYAYKDDQSAIFKMTQLFESKNITAYYYSPEDDNPKPLDEAAKEVNPAGLILVYGRNSKKEWVRDQITKVRSMLLAMQPRKPKCALYFEPPENKEDMVVRPLPRYLSYLDSSSGEEILNEYIDNLLHKT